MSEPAFDGSSGQVAFAGFQNQIERWSVALMLVFGSVLLSELVRGHTFDFEPSKPESTPEIPTSSVTRAPNPRLKTCDS